MIRRYDYRDFQYTQLTPMLNQRVETTQALPGILKENYRVFFVKREVRCHK